MLIKISIHIIVVTTVLLLYLSGLSPIMVLIAEQRLIDYKLSPEVMYGLTDDPEMEGVELIKALPLSKIKLQCVEPHKIVITARHKPNLYFELCNTRLSEKALER